MPFVVDGYVTRKVGSKKNPKAKATTRNWWLVKYGGNSTGDNGVIAMNDICLPQKYVGKRIRLKVEVIE